MITHPTAPQNMIQTANQTPGFHPDCNNIQKPTGEEVVCVACVQDGLRTRWENNTNKGNCIRTYEAFMHVHIKCMHEEEREEHMETNTKGCGRTDDRDPV